MTRLTLLRTPLFLGLFAACAALGAALLACEQPVPTATQIFNRYFDRHDRANGYPSTGVSGCTYVGSEGDPDSNTVVHGHGDAVADRYTDAVAYGNADASAD